MRKKNIEEMTVDEQIEKLNGLLNDYNYSESHKSTMRMAIKIALKGTEEEIHQLYGLMQGVVFGCDSKDLGQISKDTSIKIDLDAPIEERFAKIYASLGPIAKEEMKAYVLGIESVIEEEQDLKEKAKSYIVKGKTTCCGFDFGTADIKQIKCCPVCGKRISKSNA